MSAASIPPEVVDAAARAWHATIPTGDGTFSQRAARAALEAAAPHLLSGERQQTADAHRDAMVNRETKRAELAAAFAYGWREGQGWPTPVNVETGELFHDQAEQPDWNPYTKETTV